MNKLLKKLFVTAALVFGVSAPAFAADDVNIILYYKPGGFSHQTVEMVKGELTKRGATVNVNHLTSCKQAIDVLRKSDGNTFLWGASWHYAPGQADAKCPMDGPKEGIFPVGIAAESPIAFCASPDANLNSVSDLKKAGLKAGVASGNDGKWVQKVLDQHGLNNIEIDKYRGGGKMRKAAVAGDVDLIAISNAGMKKVKGLGKCFFSSVRNDPKGTPFWAGANADASIKDSGVGIPIWSRSNDNANVKLLQTVLSSKEYIGIAADVNVVVPAMDQIQEKIEAYAKANGS